MSKEFKVGDKVYYTGAKPQTYILEGNDNAMYPLAIEDTLFRATFTREGLSYISDSLPSIFHATEENRRKLSELYGIEFEESPVKPTSSEIIQAMLDKGEKSVSCWLSFVHKNPDADGFWGYIKQIVDGSHPFVNEKGGKYKYATPFDHTTLQPITELPEGE